MTESSVVQHIVSQCERYWAGAGLDDVALQEMSAELELHLSHAQEHGKAPEAVIGTDLPTFAETWAKEHVGATRLPTWEEVEQAESRGRRFGALAVGGVVTVAAIAAALVLANNGSEKATMDDSTWIWLWLGAAVVFSFGEVITAGFFMLPFAVGAAAAFLLSIFGVPVGIQWVVFIVISGGALLFVRNYIGHEDEHQHSVGANRFIGQRAVVTETVDRLGQGGMVRMETEDWRATTVGDAIEAGSEVVVTGITGSRLIVEYVQN